jgi:hypothetical protein
MLDPTALALSGPTLRRIQDQVRAGEPIARSRPSLRFPRLRVAAPFAPPLATDQLAPQC